MSYENKILDLPIKYWVENNNLHRTFYEWDSEINENPREWKTSSVIVSPTKYGITGSNDEITDIIEEWLLIKTGVNRKRYESHRETYGINELVKKFKKQCAAFFFLEIKRYQDNYCRIKCTDELQNALIYIPKTNELYQTFKTVAKEKAETLINNILFEEVAILNDWYNGKVYKLVKETYNKELYEWEQTDSISHIYLGSDDAEDVIIDNFGIFKELDEDTVLWHIAGNTFDTLLNIAQGK